MALESKKTKQQLHSSGRASIYALSYEHGAPPYQTAATPEQEPQIPSPSIFEFAQAGAGADGPGPGEGVLPVEPRRLPPLAACATHLELLEVFYVTRQKLLMSQDADASFAIEPQRTKKTGYNGDSKTLKDDSLWARRQVKWTTYLEFAAVRFLRWMDKLEKHREVMTVLVNGAPTLRYLPPLDVLMVWHAFMLNPRLYMDHCQAHVLYQIRMPWRLVHGAIKNREWTFGVEGEAGGIYERLNNLPVDLVDQFESWFSEDVSGGNISTRELSAFRLEDARPDTIDVRLSEAITAESSTALDDRYARLFKLVDVKLAAQLRDAVGRQADFVDKMNAKMWIRSPAVRGTLRRGIDRYEKFLKLLSMYPEMTLVPTLDIDLVWHTHQCTGQAYVNGIKTIVGRFVNHDDTIVKEKLGDGFNTTRGLFRVHFAHEYRPCGCWDCEALMSELEGASAVEEAAEVVDMNEITDRVVEEVRYHRAVELAIRNKKPLPIRG